jgi:stage III sporulation protein AB
MVMRRGLKRRREELNDFLNCFRAVAAELSYTAPGLEQCLRRAAEPAAGEVKGVFLDAAARLKDSADGEASFRGALTARRDRLALTDEDIAEIRRFGHRLGAADMENTLKQLNYTAERTALALRDAEESEAKWSRVFSGGGWLCGAALALFFL